MDQSLLLLLKMRRRPQRLPPCADASGAADWHVSATDRVASAHETATATAVSVVRQLLFLLARMGPPRLLP